MTNTKEETQPEFFKIGKFAKRVGKHNNTVDGWFKLLEAEDIHYVERKGKEKIYDLTDLKIAEFIRDKRAEGWAIEVILEEIKKGELVTLRGKSLSEDNDIAITEELSTENYNMLVQKMNLHNRKLETTLKTTLTNYINKEVPDIMKNLFAHDGKIRMEVELKLKQEAESLWHENHHKWWHFIKKYDEERSNFIAKYILDNYERVYQEEYANFETTYKKEYGEQANPYVASATEMPDVKLLDEKK